MVARAGVPARAVQRLRNVPSGTPRVRILFVRQWTASLAPVRAALYDAGIDATITVVDIEAALNAALSRDATFDVVIHDPTTPGVPRDVLEARLRHHRVGTPIVPLQSLDTLMAAVHAAMPHLN